MKLFLPLLVIAALLCSACDQQKSDSVQQNTPVPMDVVATPEIVKSTPAATGKPSASEARLPTPVINVPEPETISSSDKEVEQTMRALYKASIDKNTEIYNRMLLKIEQMANAGNAEAAFRVGRFLHIEISEKKDYPRSLQFYKLAAEKGHGWATNNIGLMYQEGDGIPVDYAKAREYFLKSTELGEGYGYRNMSRMYFEGKGIPKNIDEGVRWLENGAKKGILMAYSDLATLYCCGHYGVKKDDKKLRYYREKAAALGDSDAKWHVAQMYLTGDGVAQDTQLGMSMMEELAAIGHMDAFNSLGYLYDNGRGGVKVDKVKANYYYQLAADKGDCHAFFNLAGNYDHGWGVAINKEKATELILSAVRCENPPDGWDLWKLGTRYREGIGIRQDCQKALELFETAVSSGYDRPIVDIGYLYEKGCDSIKADTDKAFAYYLLAAKSGNSLGQNNVGAMLKHGFGDVPPDRIKAYAWLKLAVSNGSEQAFKNFNDYSSYFTDSDIEKGEKHLEVLLDMFAGKNQTVLQDPLFY